MSVNTFPPDDGHEQLRQQMRKILNKMTEDEQDVLSMRYGLHDDQLHTLAEVGQRFGLTRERIRQIEAKALRKIRYPGTPNAQR